MSLGKDTPMPVAIFEVVAPALLDGQYSKLRVDASGALLVNTSGASSAVSRFNTAGDAASIIVKASPGQLLQIDGHSPSSNVGDRFLHIFDAIAVPPNGTVPDYNPLPVSPGGTVAFFWGDVGLPLVTGIVVAVSTTRTTLTLAGADMWISGRFL